MLAGRATPDAGQSIRVVVCAVGNRFVVEVGVVDTAVEVVLVVVVGRDWAALMLGPQPARNIPIQQMIRQISQLKRN